MPLTKDDVVEALRQVEDPELGMDIVDLGLLYDVDITGSKNKGAHSLTPRGCPGGTMIQEDIHRVASELPGVEDVEIELTWDPPWTPEKMSDDAKFILGFAERRSPRFVESALHFRRDDRDRHAARACPRNRWRPCVDAASRRVVGAAKPRLLRTVHRACEERPCRA